VDAMNGEDVVFMEYDLVALTYFVQPGLVKRIIHDPFEEIPLTP
jgi:hypothetical protein